MFGRTVLDGYWEEGYHYYLEICGKRAVLRDYAKRIIFETGIRYDRRKLRNGERTELSLGETVLSRTAAGEPMSWIRSLTFEDGRIVMEYHYTITGDKTYVLEKADHGPFYEYIVRDSEILPGIQGLWLEWPQDGDGDGRGLRIDKNVLRYGTEEYDMFRTKIHAVSYRSSPDRVFLTPEDLTVTEFPGMTRIDVEKGMLTSRMIVCDVSVPLSVFLRREDLGSAEIPPEATEKARNLMELTVDEVPPSNAGNGAEEIRKE